MPTAPVSDRIAKLKAKKEQLDAQLSKLEASLKARNRKLDARRKIVVGGAVLAAIETDVPLAMRIRTLLVESVQRPADREVIADLLTPSKSEAATPRLTLQEMAVLPLPQK